MAYHAGKSLNAATTIVKRPVTEEDSARMPIRPVYRLVVARKRYANTLVRIRAMPLIHARKQRHVKRRHSSLATANTKSKPSDAWRPKPVTEIPKRPWTATTSA